MKRRLLLVLFYVAKSVLAYAGLQNLSKCEANLVLQDTMWRQSCRDQRRVQRWLAWASVRRRRKEKL